MFAGSFNIILSGYLYNILFIFYIISSDNPQIINNILVLCHIIGKISNEPTKYLATQQFSSFMKK